MLSAPAPPARALDWRLARESPRAVPPNLSAVARSPYGAPPRCAGWCCQLLLVFPPRFPPVMFVLRLKLLLRLTVILLLPPQPPLQAAPMATPTPKEIAIPAA